VIRGELLAMQELAANIRPELMRQIQTRIAQESEAYAPSNRVHALALAGHIEVGYRARSRDAEDAR